MTEADPIDAILSKLTRIYPGDNVGQMWQVACAHAVSREDLRARLGDPTYVETDSSRTAGGDEDWWGYRAAGGDVVAVCLRVPYDDAMLLVSHPSESAIREAALLFAPWTIEMYDKAYPA